MASVGAILAVAVFGAAMIDAGGLLRPTSGVEWHGPDVHLVDGYTVGAETDCQPDRGACREVIDEAMRRALELRPHIRVTRAVWAEVPSATLWTPTGAIHLRGGGGIHRFTFVVLDLDDGTRWVIPQSCYIAYTGDGRLQPVECWDGTEAMTLWRTHPAASAGYFSGGTS